jgi:uncharacterized protein YaaQ
VPGQAYKIGAQPSMCVWLLISADRRRNMGDDGGDVHCANCGIAIMWTPVWVRDQPFCCVGCAMGGPCICTYEWPSRGVHKNMKMVCAIVQDEDAGHLLDALSERGLRATKVSSTGGFLRSGNSTILMGVEDAQLVGVLDILRATCTTRRQLVGLAEASRDESPDMLPRPATEVDVGGANVFIWDIEQYIRV